MIATKRTNAGTKLACPTPLAMVPLQNNLSSTGVFCEKEDERFVNYRDEDGRPGWEGPIAHPAFACADNNTGLTCLTGLTFAEFPLSSGPELPRCYFQAGGGQLREVTSALMGRVGMLSLLCR
ncbi:hypothetical protein K504DRAFT_504329 [Pleomassaria siparia CBS 279.74]|uniref:Uncharacterized protein n=1 Tax=Pleomassaria siparia CBS 279.74 TaxID=1314801 RepID=A0A6G1K3Y5_9PLEO|nr:hypothetical protein K504DRAFT_504329 [Pleomassaria siparia CBS 279.74]